MYNAYAVIFPKNRHEFFKDIDVKKSEEGLRSMNKAKSYNVLPARFVGTPQYNKFVEVARYCNENNINPLSYLTVQFERAEHLADIGKARVGAIPYVNTLLCEEARKAYSDNVMFYRKMRNSFNLFGMSSSSVPYKGAKYEIIVALRTAYELDRTTRDNFNYLLDELASGAQQSVKQATLLGYYNTTLNALSESELVDEDQQLIRDFLKEQVLLYSRKNSLSSTIYALAFPLQINAVNSVATLKGLDKEMYYTYIGNMYKVTDVNDDEYNSFTERGRTIDFSYNANDTFFSTMRLIADCKGLGVPAGKLGSALQKFGEEKVPLDTFGMLDIERIYDKLIDSDELAKDRYIQDKDATMMSMVVTDEGREKSRMSQIHKQTIYKAISEPLFAKDVFSRLPIEDFKEDGYDMIVSTLNLYYRTHDAPLEEQTLLTLVEDKMLKQNKSLEAQQVAFNLVSDLYKLEEAETDSEAISESVQNYVRKTLTREAIMEAVTNDGALGSDQNIQSLMESLRGIMTIDTGGHGAELLDFFADIDKKKRTST